MKKAYTLFCLYQRSGSLDINTDDVKDTFKLTSDRRSLLKIVSSQKANVANNRYSAEVNSCIRVFRCVFVPVHCLGRKLNFI